jgi:protocatechuate 3,4-dioxygenase alpha subunit
VTGELALPGYTRPVFARGMLNRCVTRIYLPDEPALNGADPVLVTVPADRRPTLLAVPLADGLLEFDIHVQGDRGTVFFDL